MWGEIIGSAIGGLLGGSGSESSQTSNKIDDRLAPYIYGTNGTGGLLADVAALYRQQAAQGGLNDLQRAGLESQRQVLMSPQYTQGYDAMRSMGLGLMGGGVAQNPFTSGEQMGGQTGGLQQRPMTNAVARPNTNMQYTPYQQQQTASLMGMQAPIQSAAQYQAERPAPQAPQQTIDQLIDDYMRRLGIGRYANSAADGQGSGDMADYGGFHGGANLGDILGMAGNIGFGPAGGYLGGLIGDTIGATGSELGNNSGMGLGSATGGGGVSMGSAAGSAGDNSAELGLGIGDGGMTGSDGNGGGFGGDSGDGYAKGGKVTKHRLKGPNPKGPDDGYAALDHGEFIINSKSAKRIGYDKLARLNKR